MRAYFLRRLLLIPPTLLGVTLIVFAITRFVPGGPVEQAIMEAQMAAQSRAGSGVNAGAGQALSQQQIEDLKALYGFDKPWPLAYLSWMGDVLRGDLGKSTLYAEPVWSMIRERLPVSIFYGVITLIITYLVSIPLGVLKAIKHRTFVDNLSSILILVGYAVPGYVLGALLLVFFAARLEWFPMGGFTSFRFEELSLFGKTKDLLWHAVLPLAAYLVSSFALVTLLMKNHLMDNLASDYVRTAVSKGVSFRKAVVTHAFRNSLIPIATTFGQNIVLLVGGSFLIETIFDIDGFGLLGFNSVVKRDYPVVMGVLFVSSLLLLIGNIISDFLVALIDPRVRFE